MIDETLDILHSYNDTSGSPSSHDLPPASPRTHRQSFDLHTQEINESSHPGVELDRDDHEDEDAEDRSNEYGSISDSLTHLPLTDSAIHDAAEVHHDSEAQTVGFSPALLATLGPHSDNPFPSLTGPALCNILTPPFSLGFEFTEGVPTQPDPPLPIDETEATYLLQAYMYETATWCETTDSEEQFSVIGVYDMLDYPVCKASALALACKQLSMANSTFDDMALQLYQHTIQLLIKQNSYRVDEFVLVACIHLCVYEMMASDATDWRRHLKV